MNEPWIEKECCFSFAGKEFCAGGAVITDSRAIVYCNADMTRINDWHGKDVGPMRVVSSWKLPLSAWNSDRMYQVEAQINGKWYTGRTCGGGMIARLKLKAGQ